MTTKTGPRRNASSANRRSRAQAAAGGAARSPWLRRAARLGIAARGLVYALIAVLALDIAFNGSSEKADESGAFHTVAEQPFGKVVLWLVVVGFLGYAAWHLVDAVAGRRHESGVKGAAVRVGLALKAAIYAFFAVAAARVAAEAPESGGGEEASARLMKQTGGQWLVALVGLGIVALGAYFVIKALRASFADDLSTGRLSADARRLVLRLGRVGYLARGIVIGLVGGFVVLAALNFDPEKARGFDVALRELAGTSSGPWLLVAVALGLACFGAYSFVEARLRRL